MTTDDADHTDGEKTGSRSSVKSVKSVVKDSRMRTTDYADDTDEEQSGTPQAKRLAHESKDGVPVVCNPRSGWPVYSTS